MSTTTTTPGPSGAGYDENNEFDTGYLNAQNAASLDIELMSQPGYSLEQLMELAGLSVAEAVYAVLPSPHSRILIIAGPGNNGGDGLVAARHLVHFGHECEVVYPKPSSKNHFINLVEQCCQVGIPISSSMPPIEQKYDVIVDAIFGFSFKGAPREPFASVLEEISRRGKEDEECLIVSVDIPSGWDVNEGDVSETGFVPDVLISLTAPKNAAKRFSGRHFIGGRFLPPEIGKKYGVRMPPYPGVSQVMEIPRGGENFHVKNKDNEAEASAEDWAVQYAEYCAQKEKDISEQSTDDLKKQQYVQSESAEGWEMQYAKHCAEKEKEFFEKLDTKTK